MREYTVRVEGAVVGTRKSPRTYTHAVVAQEQTPRCRHCGHEASHHGNAAFEWLMRLPRGKHAFEPRPALEVLGFCGTEVLAHRSAATQRGKGYWARVLVVPVEVREIKERVRVRCTGLDLKVAKTLNTDLPWARTRQCTKDADGTTLVSLGRERCRGHFSTDNAAVEAEAEAIRAAASADMERRWNDAHAAEYTAETCPVTGAGTGCRVHPARFAVEVTLRKTGETKRVAVGANQAAVQGSIDFWAANGTVELKTLGG